MRKAQEVNSEMITLARESRGLSQKDLSASLGIPQGRLSKIENGILAINDDLLEKIEEILHYNKDFFFQNDRIYEPGNHFFRKYKTLPRKTLSMIHAQLNIKRCVIQRILKSIEIESNIPTFDLDETGSPEEAARALRHFWNIPSGPIDNVTNLLEDNGIPIMFCDYGTRKFSGVSVMLNNGNWMIFINANMPGDRQRFTLCHELAHITLHKIPTESMDQEADAFASEFLLPEREIKPYLSNIRLDKLAMLKRRWKVSMAAIIECAHRLKKIDYRQRTYLWTQMSKSGYRLHEPPELDIPREEPTLLKEIFSEYIGAFNYTIEDLLQTISSYKEDDFRHLFGYYLPSQERKIRIVK